MKIYRPIKLDNISQYFGKEKTAPDLWWIYNELHLLGHNGIDFVCPSGTPINWNCDLNGKVIINGVYNDGAKYVKILVEENGKLWMFRFIHNLGSDLVAGTNVETGDQIALADSTGKYTTGNHVHFDLSPVIPNGNSYDYMELDNGYKGQVDPQPYFENIWVVDKKKFLEEKLSLLTKILNLLKILVGLKNTKR